MEKLWGMPCSWVNCPTLFADGEDYVIQGYVLSAGDAAQIPLGGGETAVRVPKELLDRLRGEPAVT